MTTTRPACYGRMFPDLTRLEYNQPCTGVAFIAQLHSQGIGVGACELRVDDAGWDKCVACPDYRTCYDQCLAKLLLRWAMSAL